MTRPKTPAPTAPHHTSELDRGILSSLEVFGQSVANIAPTATPTLVIPLVFVVTGAGAWAAYLFALIVISLVALNINQFARRSASPGNIYTFIALGLGPTTAIAIGWALLIVYVGTASVATTGFTNYVNVLVQEVFGRSGGLPSLALAAIVWLDVLGAWFVTYKNVRLSTQLMLVFELVSVSLIVVVVTATFLTHREHLITDGLMLKGTGLAGLRLGLVLGGRCFFATTLPAAGRSATGGRTAAVPPTGLWRPSVPPPACRQGSDRHPAE